MMRAVVIDRHGEPELFRLAELPIPRPRAREVVLRVHGSSLNPADLRARRPEQSARLLERSFPLVLGYDCSGVVVSVGAEVAEFEVGDELFGCPSLLGQGAHAEYVAIDARMLARKPRSLTHAQAGVAPLVCLSAWQALFERARIEPSQTLLVHGGAGGVGHVAIQLAHRHGCRVIATASRPASRALCSALGASDVIDYRQEDFVARTLALTEQRGADVVLDLVGGDTLARSASATRALGQLVTLVPSSFPGATSAFMRGLTLHYTMMWTRLLHERDATSVGRTLARIATLLESGELALHVHATFGVRELARAHRLLERGGFEGKLAIDVRELWESAPPA